jgi:fatty-acyl-CoA synthase
VLKYAIEQQLRFSTLKRVLIGGAALPAVMMEQSERLGVRTVHAWGMTEMSPVGTVSTLLAKHNDEPEQHRRQLLLRQGRALYGVDMKIVADDGHELPWDGSTSGHLLVRGHWVVESYFGATDSALEEGWFATGDVATIDADGFLQIRDRSKDVIKSGGEWISSIEIENRAAAHPEVQMAACIACPHSRWGERPLLIIVPRPGSSVMAGELLSFMQGLVPKWWLPDEVLFVEDIPLTATGKVQKVALRERFRAHRLPDDRSGDEV